ncbi:extracellular solute-binding protein [Streptomyces mutabilis]|uniref:ABC transporter substrate-binding protein n=1 Tax=Streptomyces mutabilis TaxID=67332 RepID=UPI00339E4856
MNTSPRPATTALVGGLALVLTLAGCSGSDDAGVSSDGSVTITVGDRPGKDQAAARAVYDRRVADFEKANPTIDLRPVEKVWDAQTFQANVAGGTLPDVLKVPFTEIQTLIGRRQVADISDQLEESGLGDKLNPQTLKVAQKSGRSYGVPVLPYAVGMVYNRDLFTEAGLDPDKPPTTWDEVRAAAKAITRETGKAGYAQMTTENNGGWMLTAQSYSRGGSIESADGSKAVFDDAAMRDTLTTLQQMRWQDRSMGSNFLYNMNDIAKDFAAGEIGMFLSVPSAAYQAAVINYKYPAKSLGIAAVPQGPGSTNEVLSGGSVEIVSPKASDAQKAAAVKWIQYSDLGRYTDRKTALADAAASAKDGAPVGIPRLSPIEPKAFKEYESWIADYVNVPVDNFAGYTSSLDTVKLKTEPVNNAQEVYGVLDTVLQKVLTRRETDVADVLSDAVATVDTKLARARR